MTSSFHQLGLSQSRVECLEKLGFTAPTPIQSEAIPIFLEGKDIVAQAQTGTGKTAAFGLPILEQVDAEQKVVQALILTPTRELALQVSQAMKSFKVSSAVQVVAIYGGQSIERQISQIRRGAQVLVGTPGRVLDLINRGALVLDQLRVFVLDEADEMLNMGFIPDVQRILSKTSENRQTAFFSATMPPAIYKLTKQFLKDPVTVRVQQPQAAPKRIRQVAYKVPRASARAAVLQAVLELEEPDSAIVFVETRREAADLTSRLQAAGYSVDEYHGDLSQGQRERLLNRFRQGQIRWVVATDIAARGIHVDDLTHVINFRLPDNLESYVHRIGRTGRAGNEGTAISLVHTLEKVQLRRVERHVKQEIPILPTPTRAQIEAQRIERLHNEMHEALSGERLASFLPIVSQLGEEYDTQAIAAAALQMAFDRYPSVSEELESVAKPILAGKNGAARNSSSRPQVSARSSKN